MSTMIAAETSLDPDEVVGLYESVGWTAYTSDVEKLMRGLAASHLVLTARTDTGVLLGLARTVSDGETICYLQDILVNPQAQRRGIGRGADARTPKPLPRDSNPGAAGSVSWTWAWSPSNNGWSH